MVVVLTAACHLVWNRALPRCHPALRVSITARLLPSYGVAASAVQERWCSGSTRHGTAKPLCRRGAAEGAGEDPRIPAPEIRNARRQRSRRSVRIDGAEYTEGVLSTGGQVPTFKALVDLQDQQQDAGALKLSLAAGMQLSAEIIKARERCSSILLSPIQRDQRSSYGTSLCCDGPSHAGRAWILRSTASTSGAASDEEMVPAAGFEPATP
jgi:hypothetical protein